MVRHPTKMPLRASFSVWPFQVRHEVIRQLCLLVSGSGYEYFVTLGFKCDEKWSFRVNCNTFEDDPDSSTGCVGIGALFTSVTPEKIVLIRLLDNQVISCFAERHNCLSLRAKKCRTRHTHTHTHTHKDFSLNTLTQHEKCCRYRQQRTTGD